MAFGRTKFKKKHMGLMSLIDVIFLLLIFFLVVSVFINSDQSEYSIQVPSPKIGEGEANILIQILDDGQFLFMDKQFFTRMDQFLADPDLNYGWNDDYSPQEKSTQFQALLKTIARGGRYFGVNLTPIPSRLKVLSESQLNTRMLDKIDSVVRENANSEKILNYIVLVRCPSAVPYGTALRVIDLVQRGDDARQFFDYGLSGGSLKDFTEGGAVQFEKNGAFPSELVIVFNPQAN